MRRIVILSACLLGGVHLEEGRVLDVSDEDRLLLLSGNRARDALPEEELTPIEATSEAGADDEGEQASLGV